jgi:hypothetical protein
LENTLRGESGAQFLARTHCPRGHAYTPDNILKSNGKSRNGTPHRGCKACSRERSVIRKARTMAGL